MSVNVYMIFNGNCREAVGYYTKIFGVETPEISLYGEMPAEPGQEIPEEMKDLVMHTSLDIHGSAVMFSDNMMGSPVVVGKNINVIVQSEDLEEMTSEFNRLAQDGKIVMEMQKTFWSEGYGVVEDKYGIVWQFSHDDGSYAAG